MFSVSGNHRDIRISSVSQSVLSFIGPRPCNLWLGSSVLLLLLLGHGVGCIWSCTASSLSLSGVSLSWTLASGERLSRLPRGGETGNGDWGESKKVTRLEPRGGELVSLSFWPASLLSAFSQCGSVSFGVTEVFASSSLKQAHDFVCQARPVPQLSEPVVFLVFYGCRFVHTGGWAGPVLPLLSVSQWEEREQKWNNQSGLPKSTTICLTWSSAGFAQFIIHWQPDWPGNGYNMSPTPEKRNY